MARHYNDYTVIVFIPGQKAKKWTYVHKLDGFARFLDKSYPDWHYMNVYNRRKGGYLCRFYRSSVIPAFCN